jgi:colicin import membrane protein
MDVKRPCGVRKSKINPNPYTKDELVELAIDLGYTKTEVKKMSVKELCEMLKKKPRKSVRKSPRKVSRKTVRKSPKKSSRRILKKSVKKSSRKVSRKSPKKSSRKVSRKTVRKSPRKSYRKVSKKTVRKSPKKSSRKVSKKSPKKSSRRVLSKSPKKTVRKSPRKSSRKISRKTVRKSPRKSSRKTVRKSPRKSSRKTVRKSPRKSSRKVSRKTVRKSPRKSSRKVSRKSVSPVEAVSRKSVSSRVRKTISKSTVKGFKCINDLDILSQEEIKDIPKNKIIKLENGYCYNVDFLVEYLISSKDLNRDPSDNRYELWKDSVDKSKILTHKGLDFAIQNRYYDMLAEYKKESQKFVEKLVSSKDNIKLLNDIATLGFMFVNYDEKKMEELSEVLKRFYEIFNKNKDKEIWSRIRISDNSLGQILQDSKDTCNHAIGRELLKYYLRVYNYVTKTYKKDIPLSKYFYKLNDNMYIVSGEGYIIYKKLLSDTVLIYEISTYGSINRYQIYINKNGEYNLNFQQFFSSNDSKYITETWEKKFGKSPSIEVKKIYNNIQEQLKDLKNFKFESE